MLGGFLMITSNTDCVREIKNVNEAQEIML